MRRRAWESLLTWYPPGRIEMLEREAAAGDGWFVEGGEKMTAVVAVGKWESRGLGGDSQAERKTCFWFFS